MRLNLLFIVMEVLTLLAYPIVFLHGKLHPFPKSKASVPLVKELATVPVAKER